MTLSRAPYDLKRLRRNSAEHRQLLDNVPSLCGIDALALAGLQRRGERYHQLLTEIAAELDSGRASLLVIPHYRVVHDLYLAGALITQERIAQLIARRAMHALHAVPSVADNHSAGHTAEQSPRTAAALPTGLG